MKKFGFLILALVLSSMVRTSISIAEPLLEGSGLVYGEGYAFNLKAPKGWVLDTESGLDQGLHAVFYPKGGSWTDSTVIAYARSRPKVAPVMTPEDAAQDTIRQFHSKGNPNYKGSKLKTIKTDGGQDVVIYQFSGDQWGNSEAVAYFVEDKQINFIVLSSRDAKAYEQAMPAFEDLAKSYKAMPITVKGPKYPLPPAK